MKRHALLTGGFGVAAMLAIGAATFLSDRTVQAGTIFQSLRQAAASSRLACVRYNDIAHDKGNFRFGMDLELYIVRNEDGHIAKVYAASEQRDGNMSFNLAGTTFEWDMTGSMAKQILVQHPDSGWAFYQLARLPEDFVRTNPSALPLYPFLNMARGGMFVTGLAAGTEGRMPKMINMDVEQLGDSGSFESLIDRIETLAGDIRVVRQDNGSVLLEASDFGGRAGEIFSAFSVHGQAGADPFLIDLFSEAVFEVLYHPDHGVERIRVLHLGDRDGSIEIQFDDQVEDFEDDLFDLEFHRRKAPDTPVLDWAVIESRFRQAKAGPVSEDGTGGD